MTANRTPTRDELEATAGAQPSAVVAHLAPGVVFAREFRVVRLVGRGGMGAVYEVEQLSTGRHRALKLMDPNLVADGKARERFLQEARVGSQIESDHVVEVVDAGIDGDSGTPWIAMELLKGETLGARLAARGPFAPADAREVLEQLGHALRAAHASGIVHRDIKPENVFLADPRRTGVSSTVKVLDFGIAKLLHSAQTTGRTTASVGSPMWMAPEQAGTGKVSAATDVWALGLLAYHLLTGRYYWRAAESAEATVTALLTEILVETIEPASVRAAQAGVASRVPPGFDAWFARCVARDPASRFADAGAAVDALVPLLGGASAPGPGAVAAGAATAAGTTVLSGESPSRSALDTGTPAATDAVAATLPSGPQHVPTGVLAGGARAVAGRSRSRAWIAVVVVVVAAVAVLFVLRQRRGAARRAAEERRQAVATDATGPAAPSLPGVIPAVPAVPSRGSRSAGVQGVAVAAPPPPLPPAVAGLPPPPTPPAVPPPRGAGALPVVPPVPPVPPTVPAPPSVAGASSPPVPPLPPAPPAVPSVPAAGGARGSRRLTPAGRAFLNTVVLPCWRDVLAAEPQPGTPASFTVPYGAGGRPTNVRIEGVPTDGVFTTFRRCVVTRGTERFAFDPIPEEAEVVIRTRLPAGP